MFHEILFRGSWMCMTHSFSILEGFRNAMSDGMKRSFLLFHDHEDAFALVTNDVNSQITAALVVEWTPVNT